MFSPNEVENYQQIKASDDLKEKVIKNVAKTHKRNQKIAIRFAAATACLALAVFGVNMHLHKNHDEPTPLSLTNMEQNPTLRISIPLEVKANEEVEITVTDGTITTNVQKNTDVIIWCISHEDAENAQCNIVINGKEYVYELLYDEKNNNYSIRQIKTDNKEN